MGRALVVADIGGTHARFALAEIDGGRVISMGQPVTLRTAEHASFETAWQQFARGVEGKLPDALGMAFAGPVDSDTLKLTNNPWVIRPSHLQERLGVRSHKIVNDFGAVAHAVTQLGSEHFDHVCGPDIPLPATGMTSIIGPGTGLGVAQLLKTASGHHVIETEGGHIDFAPLDALEEQILAHLRRSFRRVSVERIIAGGGLVNLYNAIAAIEGRPAAAGDEKSIWGAALAGDDQVAVAALDRFFLSLGSVAGDLALAHGSNAVVIAGGLGYRLRERIPTSGFNHRFIAKGRFERRMEGIPVKLLNHPQPGLFGAAVAFAQEFAETPGS